jgi:eukaryotic-like serine/threonine-protein kinase
MENLIKPLISISLIIILIWSCSKEATPTVTPTPTPTPVATKSSAKDITKFSFAALSPAVDATIDATSKTISATVPAGTDVTKLVPTITISDKATVSPATGVATDFSKEVSYTVTAEDGSTVIWKVNVTKELPPVQNDMVFYGGDDKKVYALDAETGTKKWEFLATGTGKIESAPAYVEGVLYVGTSANQVGTLDPGKLYALDAKTGTKRWEFQTDGVSLSIRTSPMVLDGVIYFGTVNIKSGGSDYFYAVDASTGKSIWKTSISPKTPSSSSIYSSPTAVNGVVYFSSYNRIFYALDIKTGNKKWEYDYSFLNYSGSSNSPVVANGNVYFGHLTLLAFDAQSGVKKWEYKGAFANGDEYDSFVGCDATIANGLLFVGNNSTKTNANSKLVALNPSDGTKKWDFQFTNSNYVTHFTAENSILFATTGGSTNDKLVAFDVATGTKKWEYADVLGYLSTPTPANGIVYLTSQGKKVYAVDAKTGAKKWEYTSSAVILESCVVVDKNGKGFHSSRSGMVQ